MDTSLPAAHVERLNSLALLKEQGFTGPDVTLSIALGEYGLAWRELPEEKEILFVYRHPSIRDRFDRCSFSIDTDVRKEFNWVTFEDVQNCNGLTAAEWDALPLAQKVYDLVNYYGVENVFGTSYWEGFAIAGIED